MTNQSVETHDTTTRVGDHGDGVVDEVSRAVRRNEVPQGPDDGVRGAGSGDSAIRRRVLVSNSARKGIDQGNLESPNCRWPERHQGQQQENVDRQDNYRTDGIDEQVAQRNDEPDDDIEQRMELPGLFPSPNSASILLRRSGRQSRDAVPEDALC